MAHIDAKARETRPVRLAESGSIAVDLCACGTLQLHFGALTLRLNADGMARLFQTLGRALVRAREASAEADATERADLGWRRPHGDA